ncbi:MAG TPA: UGSC family (seleno)protein [Xanthobacteraceae bacterium]|nr:UGSC family (seleno)protein [Xanthobacteraceae bacterium]
MSLEQAGIPAVAVHTQTFARLANTTARAAGMPRTRQAFVPQPLVGQTPDQLRGYVEGVDPVAKRPFMQIVLEGLTQPLGDEDIKGLSFERTTPRTVTPDTEENLQRLFIENSWTDFLPVILPTEERVEAMLKGTSRKPDEVVARLRPASFREFWEMTVEKIAVNAVMAGARPEYFPVILAHAATGMTARSSSTTSWAVLSVVNGPIRKEIGMNDSIGVLGPFNHANATIGRAYNLLSINGQGGAQPGENYMGSMGNPYNYSACFAEAEERSPWQPLHVQRGFKPTDSTVTVFLGGWYSNYGFGPRETWQEKMRHCLAASEHFSAPLLVMDPIAARGYAELGFDTKEKLSQWCADNALLTAREYWDNQWVQTLHLPHAVAGVEPYASRLKAKPDEVITIFEPKDINIVVAGGETQGAWKMISGMPRGPKATVSIDEWR